jgi:hypothetical protein
MPERNVRPGILTSEAINRLSWPQEVFYRRLMSVVDDYGRFDGRNSVLRATLYPLRLDHVSDADVGKWKLATAEAGLVSVYIVDNKEFIEMRKFDQRMRGKPKWPAPVDSESPQLAASCREPPPSSETETETNPPLPPVAGGRRAPPGFSSAFLRVWAAAPSMSRDRSSRAESFKVWREHKLEVRCAEVLESLERWKQSAQWQKDDGQYVLGLHRWLRNRKYEEVPSGEASNESEPREPTEEELERAYGGGGKGEAA